ncbi:MAG: hypothetical protein Q8M16_09465 [Pirellulaceae bacterium]|nr:hypothetical protein [Pirellulaceae bacterium]
MFEFGSRVICGTSAPSLPIRPGNAMVELVMGFIPLTMMFGLLLWVGVFAVSWQELACENRHENWSRRYHAEFSKNTTKPFEFSEDKPLEQQSSRRVPGFGVAFAAFPVPIARSSITTGSWDHHQIPFDRSPQWELALRLAGKSQPEKLRGLQLPPKIGRNNQQLANVGQQQGSQLGSITDLLGQLMNWRTGSSSQIIDDAKSDAGRQLAQMQAEHKQAEQESEAKVAQAKENLARATQDRLGAERKLRELQEKRDEATEEEKIAELDAQIEALKKQIPRLKSDESQAELELRHRQQALRDLQDNPPPEGLD